MAALVIHLTRLSPTHHSFEVIRGNGQVERVALETKTFLIHDLLHFAVETEAGLKSSFFGMLAAGASYEALAADTMPLAGERLATERIVGPLTSVAQGKRGANDFIDGLAPMFQATGDAVPAWATPAFVEGALVRYRSLAGRWKATPFGQTIELRFE